MVAPTDNPLPPGSMISGSANGVGEGSAKLGSSYVISATVLFANGDTVMGKLHSDCDGTLVIGPLRAQAPGPMKFFSSLGKLFQNRWL